MDNRNSKINDTTFDCEFSCPRVSFRKLISVVLTVVMLLLSMTLSISAAVDELSDMFRGTASASGDATPGKYTYESLTYDIINDNIIIQTSADASGDISIPSEIDGYPVVSIDTNAFYNCRTITSINIPDSVTSIGDFAFYDCTNLTSVTIGDGITWIGEGTFENCYSLTKVTIPDSVTSIGSWAFYDCSSLTSITIPDSVTSIGTSAFSGCSSLTKVTIPDSVTSIGRWVFYGCSSLTKVTIPDSVTSIDEFAFSGCSSLTSVNITDISAWCSIDFHNSYSNPLYYAENLYLNGELVTDLVIPDDVTSIGSYAFSDCNLTSVNIPDSVTNIGNYAFYNCSSLTSVNIPDSVTNIGNYAFCNCSSLTSITIPDSVTYIDDSLFQGTAFYNDSSNWENEVLYIGKHLIKAKATISGKYEIKEGTKNIADSAFSGCSSLTSVTIPDSATSIGSRAFVECTNLTSVTIGSRVTSIGAYTFYYCISLTSITIPDSVTSIGSRAFYRCSSLIIKCFAGSYADLYAQKNLIPVEYILCDHVFTNYISDNNSTCTEDGTKTAICDNGCGKTDTVIAEGSALGHSFTNYYSDNNGTCTEDGTMTAYCDNDCGMSDTIIDENSKRHDYVLDVLREPTCIKTGLGIYMCSICKDYYTAVIETKPHVYTQYSYNNDATCNEDGTETACCEYGCGATDTKTAEDTALGHIYSNYVYNNDATCKENGTKTAYCDRDCGEINTITAEGTVLDHSFTVYVFNDDSSCTSLGTMTAICDNGCGVTDTTNVVGEPAGHDYIEEIIEESTCTTEGIALYVCIVCSDYYTDIIPETDHVGEWIVITEPTSTSEGEKTFTCTVCGYTETEVVPALGIPVISTNNYDVSITCAEYITYIRYASGDYNSASEIKNAEDCVTLNASKISAYTKDGICTIAMPDGGMYSLWVKLNDGTEYIYKADLTVMDQEIEADGVTMTVKNLYGVKDYFIAKGSHSTYSDVKANSVVQITKNKIGSKHDYTYVLSEPGTYTVCVRYDDSARAHKFMTVELTVVEPAFTENGLQLKVSNLDGVKVIRTAYGDYNTPGEIKRAEGTRAFTAKTIAKSGDEYTIQYRENGLVSVAVVYNNGYEVIYKYNVTKKTPGFEQNGDTVTFTNLEGFKVIRYAKGEYTTSTQLKNAKGSVTVSSKNMTDTSYSVTLAPATYTFCVQYDDESYNYYTVVVK